MIPRKKINPKLVTSLFGVFRSMTCFFLLTSSSTVRFFIEIRSANNLNAVVIPILVQIVIAIEYSLLISELSI